MKSLRAALPSSHPARRMTVPIEVQRVGGRGEPLPLPSYATSGSAGLDLRADEAVTLRPGERALVPTGIAIAVPPGYEAQVRPRSGLALRNGLTCLNSP
jgi:dUTP pyrophosphatase